MMRRALTCLGNDLGYENVFAKQLDFHARPGDLLIAISSSGRIRQYPERREIGASPRLQGGDVFRFYRRQRFAAEPATSIFTSGPANTASSRVAHLALCHAVLDIDMGWGQELTLARSAGTKTSRKGMGRRFKRVLVTGGAGYVGSSLVPKLLKAGYEVAVLDLYIYGDVFANQAANQSSPKSRATCAIRPMCTTHWPAAMRVIHLACISNDPSFDLNPELGKSINFDCFRPLVKAAKDAGVKRFIYASSSSVYGIKDELDVTEDLPLVPLTDYSKYKAMCEEVLEQEREPGICRRHVAPGHGLRLCAAIAARPHRQHPHQSRHQ